MKQINLERYEFNQEVAQVKYQLIAPILSQTYVENSQEEYFRRISQLDIEMPDGKKQRFAPATIKSWVIKYRKSGIDGLQANIRMDYGGSRKLNVAAINRMKELITEFPKITAVMIYQKLIEEGTITKSEVSVDTFQRFIKKNDLRTGCSATLTKERRTWEYAHTCDGYEADTCHTFYIFDANGDYRKTYLIAIIDNHSRMIVGARFFFHDNSVNFQLVWKEAILRFGRSSVLILDNGTSYKNKTTTQISSKLGTQLIYNPPYTPQGKALIERFFRTIKDKWLNGDHGKNYHSLEELNQQLAQWIANYNRNDHSALKDDTHDNHTPFQRYMYDMKDIPPWKLVNKSEIDYIPWVTECFLHEETRKVNGDSTIVINHMTYDVPSQYIGISILVRYDPKSYETVYLYDPANKNKIDLKRTDKIENGKTRRTEIIY